MATIGLKNLYYAPVIKDDHTGTTYGAVKYLMDAISAEVTPEEAEQTLHANDAPKLSIKAFKGGSIKFVGDDLPQEIFAELFGSQIKQEHVLSKAGDIPIYVALSFMAKRHDGTYQFVWLYKVVFNLLKDQYATIGDSIEFKVPELEGKLLSRADGAWRNRVIKPESFAETWFSSVQELPAG